jgi:uncharacterized protein
MKKILVLLLFALNISVFSEDIFDTLYGNDELKIREFLEENDINVFKDSDGRSVLMALLENYENDIIDIAISKTEDINEADNDGWTALMYACFSTDNLSIYQKLLKKGASISQFSNDDFNMNSLMVAIWQNRSLDVIKLLSEDKDSVNWKNKDSVTPFIIAEKFYSDDSIFEVLKKSIQ